MNFDCEYRERGTRLLRLKIRAFTLVEILVASAVFVLLLALILSIVTQTSDVWRSTSNKITAFQSARAAFERMTRQISQATLNTYYDYYDLNWNRRTKDNANTFVPRNYGRQSELHFRTGVNLLNKPTHAIFFQAPASRTENSTEYGGLEGLLNACGFFIDYVEDDIPSPYQGRVSSKSRYRLMQWVQNTENLAIYNPAASSDAWFQNADQEAVPLADNIIALIIWPRLPEGEPAPEDWVDSYEYDSREEASGRQPVKQHQLPPIVQIAMVAIDNRSADRLGDNLKSKIDAALSGLFKNLDSNNPGKSMQDDLEELEKRLKKENIEYRIFESAVPLREAKWSKK